MGSYSYGVALLVLLFGLVQGHETFTQLDLNKVLMEVAGRQQLSLAKEERLVYNTTFGIRHNSPEYRHSGFVFAGISKKSENSGAIQDAIISLSTTFNMSPSEVQARLRELDLTNTVLRSDSCTTSVTCTDAKYRSFDGSCNNLAEGSWGMADEPFGRMIGASYDDDVSEIRLSTTGAELPNARVLTLNVLNPGAHQASSEYVMHLMVWGQFIAHDLVHAPVTAASDESAISCCTDEGLDLDESELHDECLPIAIDPTEQFFGRFLGTTCMNFVRSQFSIDCDTADRAQLNANTNFMDASNVYGQGETAADALRSFEGGKLTVTEVEGDNLLPTDREADSCAELDDDEEPICFAAGDGRVNEQPTLALTHTIWMRQHNKVAEELEALNPSWTDEDIYQETRRIIGAQHQHITYEHYLPIILGDTLMNDYALYASSSGGYDSSRDPTISNGFGVAAFRFGHSQIPGQIQFFDEDLNVVSDEKLRMSNFSFAPSMLFNSYYFDGYARGLQRSFVQEVDSMFSTELTNRLLSGNETGGLDLASLNIQRGRDHGMPSYSDFRAACGLSVPSDFSDLEDIDSDDQDLLSAYYDSVDDIDLYVGGIMENAVSDGLIGPTFGCIIADTFAGLKFGDRYFYTFTDQTGSFSSDQITELQKTSLARIFCDNSQGITKIQSNVFRKAQSGNTNQDCTDTDDIPEPSWALWEDEALP